MRNKKRCQKFEWAEGNTKGNGEKNRNLLDLLFYWIYIYFSFISPTTNIIFHMQYYANDSYIDCQIF